MRARAPAFVSVNSPNRSGRCAASGGTLTLWRTATHGVPRSPAVRSRGAPPPAMPSTRAARFDRRHPIAFVGASLHIPSPGTAEPGRLPHLDDVVEHRAGDVLEPVRRPVGDDDDVTLRQRAGRAAVDI